MMKRHFSRVVALSLLAFASVPSWAQPPTPVEQEQPVAPTPRKKVVAELFGKTADSAVALTTLGGFLNKMTRAKSGVGVVTIITTSTKDGKVVLKTNLETLSVWKTVGKDEDATDKFVSYSTLTRIEGDKTTVEKFTNLDDGTKYYNLDETRNVWSQQDEDVALPISISAAALAWNCALSSFRAGNEIKGVDKTINGQAQTEVSDGPNNKYLFDSKSGDLLSWTLAKGDLTIEFRWLPTGLDVPLADSQFDWKVPDAATLVAAETMKSYDADLLLAIVVATFFDE